MRIKLLFLIVAALTLLKGISAQSPSRDKPNTSAKAHVTLPLISVSSLSDTQGVEFKSYLAAWKKATQGTWEKMFPQEVRDKLPEKEDATIRFKLLPNGELMSGSMVLEGRSGSTAFDRAAWGALTNSKYPPLPSQFHGPYLELRTEFSFERPKM